MLAHYSPTARVKVTADASSRGLGAVLTQLNKGFVVSNLTVRIFVSSMLLYRA